uniref:Uncharacterized protein n=1 Tax=Candidatus Kentrum sp. LFY TaxID=2126342 RepID=A0A450VD79_9GAMM|nr:MAG: hypothetical protein BECKLFY1418A_GA0070994_12281 [Candidatus Kentron sp. LFY]
MIESEHNPSSRAVFHARSVETMKDHCHLLLSSVREPNPAKPEPKFHRMEDMLALRAKTEAGWVLAGALVLSGFLFFRYLEGYVISTGGRCESRAFRAKS